MTVLFSVLPENPAWLLFRLLCSSGESSQGAADATFHSVDGIQQEVPKSAIKVFSNGKWTLFNYICGKLETQKLFAVIVS